MVLQSRVSKWLLLGCMLALTLSWAFENDIEFLHVIVDQRHLVVAHHELHDIRLYSALGTAHLATDTRHPPSDRQLDAISPDRRGVFEKQQSGRGRVQSAKLRLSRACEGFLESVLIRVQGSALGGNWYCRHAVLSPRDGVLELVVQ